MGVFNHRISVNVTIIWCNSVVVVITVIVTVIPVFTAAVVNIYNYY